MNKNVREFILIFIYSISLLVFREQLNSIILLFLGVFIFIKIWKLNIKEDKHFIILKLIIYSLPFAFTNIFGTSYSDSPISWFNIFLFSFMIYTISKIIKGKKIKLNKNNIIIILFLLLSLSLSINSIDFWDAISQISDIFITFTFLILISQYKWGDSEKKIIDLLKSFVIATIVSGFGVFLQYLFFTYFNLNIGFVRQYAGDRTAFGYLFSDFSFLSIFLTSGALLTIMIRHYCNLSTLIYWSIILLLLSSSIITSARTGFISFMVVFSILSIYKLINSLNKGNILNVFSILLFQILILFGLYAYTFIRSGDLLADSGRTSLNLIALDIFYNSPVVGFGFGGETYRNLVSPLPHNLLIQSLVQGGLIYTIPLVIIFILILFKVNKIRSYMLPVLLCILIGSFFVPNIFASRFLGVILALSLLSLNKEKKYDKS